MTLDVCKLGVNDSSVKRCPDESWRNCHKCCQDAVQVKLGLSVEWPLVVVVRTVLKGIVYVDLEGEVHQNRCHDCTYDHPVEGTNLNNQVHVMNKDKHHEHTNSDIVHAGHLASLPLLGLLVPIHQRLVEAVGSEEVIKCSHHGCNYEVEPEELPSFLCNVLSDVSEVGWNVVGRAVGVDFKPEGADVLFTFEEAVIDGPELRYKILHLATASWFNRRDLFALGRLSPQTKSPRCCNLVLRYLLDVIVEGQVETRDEVGAHD